MANFPSKLNPVERLKDRIEESERYLKKLESGLEKLKACNFKIGQPAWHSSYKVCLILDIRYNEGHMDESPEGLVANIAHALPETQQNTTVPLHELMPYNESTKVLYE